MEYLKKTEFTGCHQGMRYRLEQTEDPEGGKKLLVTVWPEPFNFLKTPEEKKQGPCSPLTRTEWWMRSAG